LIQKIWIQFYSARMSRNSSSLCQIYFYEILFKRNNDICVRFNIQYPISSHFFFIARALHRRKARCAKNRTNHRPVGPKRSEKVERVKFAAYIGRLKIPSNATDPVCLPSATLAKVRELECSSFVPLSRTAFH